MTVILIALVPAIAVILIAIWSARKSVTLIAAVLAVALSLFTGNPAYAVLDAVAVLAATSLALNTVDFGAPKPSQAPTPPSQASSTSRGSGAGLRSTSIWILGLSAVAIYFWTRHSHEVAHPVPPPAQSPAPRAQYEPPLQPVTGPAPTPPKPDRKSAHSSATPQPKRSLTQDSNNSSGAWPSGRSASQRPDCVYKGVMSDQDYRNCGLKPPQP